MIIGEVPFGYAIEGNKLKLHYFGVYTCDHIPATFVFKRTKYYRLFRRADRSQAPRRIEGKVYTVKTEIGI
jgi:hypothetical protein